MVDGTSGARTPRTSAPRSSARRIPDANNNNPSLRDVQKVFVNRTDKRISIQAFVVEVNIDRLEEPQFFVKCSNCDRKWTVEYADKREDMFTKCQNSECNSTDFTHGMRMSVYVKDVHGSRPRSVTFWDSMAFNLFHGYADYEQLQKVLREGYRFKQLRNPKYHIYLQQLRFLKVELRDAGPYDVQWKALRWMEPPN